MNCQVFNCNEYAIEVIDVYKYKTYFVHVCKKHLEEYKEEIEKK